MAQSSSQAFNPFSPLVPVLEPKNFLDVQLVFARTAVFRDLVDEDCDFGDSGIHAVGQA